MGRTDKKKRCGRLTFVQEQQHFKVIGENFLKGEQRLEVKVPKVHLSNKQGIETVPPFHLFLIGQLPAIQ